METRESSSIAMSLCHISASQQRGACWGCGGLLWKQGAEIRSELFRLRGHKRPTVCGGRNTP